MGITKLRVKQLRIGLLCFCTTLMFYFNFEVPEISDNPGFLYHIIENLRNSITVDFFSMTIVFSALCYISVKIEEHAKNNTCILYVFNFMLASLWLISEGFCVDDTIVSLYCSPGQIVKSVIYVTGAAHLLNCISRVLYALLLSGNTGGFLTGRTVTGRFYNNHPFLFWFVIMLIVWMPNTILSHPASIECDVWDSLYQYFGKAEFTAHHPPFFTVLAGWSASFGLSLGDINKGFFLWVVLQTIICASIMAYVLYTMKLLNTPRWLILLTFFTAALSPLYSCYVTTIVKDTLYSFAVLLYLVELVYMHTDWKKYWRSAMHICLFFLSNIAMILLRHNGKYIICIMLVYLLLKCISGRQALPWKDKAGSAVLLVLPILVANGISAAVIHHYHVTVQEGESMRESLSIPFQQSARYAGYYASETPEEEKAAIDRVIDYYALAGVYEPAISDPVKSRFHYYATREDWVNYFKVWFRQFTRHPLTYFGATLNQNYYLFYPMRENSRFYYSTYVDYFYDHSFMDDMGAAKSMTFPRANDIRIST